MFLKKLRKIKSVSLHGYHIVKPIVEALQKNKIKIIKYEDHRNEYLKYVEKDFYEIETWSTFEECVIADITYKNKKYFLKVFVYNGNTLWGYKEHLRFTVDFKILDLKFIKFASNSIEHNYDEYLDMQYQKYCEFKKNIFKFFCSMFYILF